MYHIGLQVLRAKIRGFQEAGMTITARIGKSERERKNRLWNQKRSLGHHCRHHLLAYALLRGVPYEEVERCSPNNRPEPKLVLDIALAHNRWTAERGKVNYDIETVKAWLARAASSPTLPGALASSPATPSPAPTAVPTSVGPRRLLEGARRLLEKLG